MYGDLTSGLEVLDRRARLAKALAWLVIAIFLLTLPLDVARITGALNIDEDGPLSLPALFVYALTFPCYLASVVFVGMWIHRAHANLFAARLERLEFTPGWSVGWFFVPIANLFKPFEAMRELWNRSHGDAEGFVTETPPLVARWWACYIIGNILMNLSQRIEASAIQHNLAPAIGLGTIGTLLFVASAWLLILIINAVGTAQRSMMGVAETFG